MSIQRMSADEYNRLSINYRFAESDFGHLIIASTDKGVCYLAFFNDDEDILQDLKKRFTKAVLQEKTDDFQEKALQVFQNNDLIQETSLHLNGTDFQFQVWETLLNIPSGSLSTYGDIARFIGNPKASRAVGTAVGSNPVSYLVPCHRVIGSSGNLGGYHWGLDRKKAMIRKECRENS
ncbi:MAG: methylated-DNA--[protein]-cysteine S-methyltransferase [Dysgonamonadaceae bacterium]|nr:methylated-DNA--[protein]-cysteine S-methyltransferase [Dysgonamonadaceae bacterium]